MTTLVVSLFGWMDGGEDDDHIGKRMLKILKNEKC